MKKLYISPTARQEFILKNLRGRKVLDCGIVGDDFETVGVNQNWLHGEIVKRAGFTVGVDIDASNLEKISTKFPGFNLKKVDLSKKLPFSNGEFEIVVAGDILEHLPNMQIFLQETHRVLKEDGEIIGTVPNAWNIEGLLKFIFFKKQPDATALVMHLQIFDEWSLNLQLLQNGFLLQEIGAIYTVGSAIVGKFLRFSYLVYPDGYFTLGFRAKKVDRSIAENEIKKIKKEIKEKRKN